MTSAFRTRIIRTLTVPLDADSFPGGLPSFLVRDDVLCWTRREAGLVGFGEVARFTATGPERFLEADIWWRHLVLEADVTDAVGCPGTGPVAFGSFAFSKVSAHESRLIVPEIVVGLRDGNAWLTQLTFDDGELTEAGARAALRRWLDAPGAPASGDPAPSEPQAPAGPQAGREAKLSTGSLSEADWIAAEILRQLAVRYRECWTYGVDGLVGSTPEMLIQVEGRTAQARVLAGTLDRRDAEGMAGSPLEFAERVLAGSEKQRHEHDIAIQSLTTQLAPFSEAMNAHSEPFILELPNVWHLASDVKAELAEVEGHVPTCLALINALHPTAAVCGTPTTVAGALIRKLEHLDRGPYAGPVGWLDAAGNGEWGIALRGAVIEGPDTVRLYAGCGVVEGSVPEAELAETWAKFRPMLESLGIDS